MSARTFAQINVSLLRSKKIKECNHSERWAYICAHLTPLGNYMGLFEFPLAMWARDANLPPEAMQKAIEKLVYVGLVEYDFDEELVRIVGFHRQRPPDNASKVTSLTFDFYSDRHESKSRELMRLGGIAEFSVAAVQRAQQWRSDSPEHDKLRNALGPFLSNQWQEHGCLLLELIDAELEHAKKATRDEFTAIFPPILSLTNDNPEAPCPHPADTVPAYVDVDVDVDETNTQTRRRKDEDENGANSKIPSRSEVVALNQTLDGLRKSGSQHGPLEATKRSALGKGGR